MSSKCAISARAPSWFEFREDECNDEDFEDFEPVKSGGEPGTAGAKVVISSSLPYNGDIRLVKDCGNCLGVGMMFAKTQSSGGSAEKMCLLIVPQLSNERSLFPFPVSFRKATVTNDVVQENVSQPNAVVRDEDTITTDVVCNNIQYSIY